MLHSEPDDPLSGFDAVPDYFRERFLEVGSQGVPVSRILKSEGAPQLCELRDIVECGGTNHNAIHGSNASALHQPPPGAPPCPL